MSKFVAASLLLTVALPAQATTYTQLINLVGCRSVPSEKNSGLDTTAVGADWGAVGLAYKNFVPLDDVNQTTVVCDLRLPPNATLLRSVTLEYLLSAYAAVAPTMELKVYLSEQLTPAVPYTPNTRFSTKKIGNCLAATPPDNVNTLFTCSTAPNQTLVPYIDYTTIKGRIVPVDRHDLFSSYATVTLPYGFTGEGYASGGNAYRLRVSYDAP